MSLDAAPGPAVTATSADRTAGEVWRSARGPVITGVVLLLVGLLAVVLRGLPTTGYLDPSATTGPGGRAVARVLADSGVAVTQVGTVDAALAATGTVFVPRPELLPPGELERLAGMSADRLLVVAGPSQALLDRLAPGVVVDGNEAVQPRLPACEVSLFSGLGQVDLGGLTFDVGSAPAGVQGCFAVGGSATLLSVGGTTSTPRAVLLGSGDLITNGLVGERANAALALRLLGSEATVTWLLPAEANLLAADGQRQGFLGLLPGWILLAAGQVAVAVVLFALWRARRLGPVVSEPLPVVVRAAESVEGRGRLYRRARAHDRAAAALRGGTLARLLAPLGLPPDAEPYAVVSGLAERTGRRPADLGGLLYGAAPSTDSDLVSLAGALDELVETVLSPSRTPPTPEDRTP